MKAGFDWYQHATESEDSAYFRVLQEQLFQARLSVALVRFFDEMGKRQLL